MCNTYEPLVTFKLLLLFLACSYKEYSMDVSGQTKGTPVSRDWIQNLTCAACAIVEGDGKSPARLCQPEAVTGA